MEGRRNDGVWSGARFGDINNIDDKHIPAGGFSDEGRRGCALT